MPEMKLGDVLCDVGNSAANSASDPVSTCIHPELLFDEVMGGPYVGLLHRLSQLAISDGPCDGTLNGMLRSLARALGSNLACIVRQSDDHLVVTRHSTRSSHSLAGDTIRSEDDPTVRPFMENGCPVITERVHEACGDGSFFRKGLSISAFALFPISSPECDRCGLLLTWQQSAPGLRSEQLVTLGSIANLFGTVLRMRRLWDDLEFERNTRRRYTRLVAGREVRMAELKSENAKLKDLVIELSRRIGDLERV